MFSRCTQKFSFNLVSNVVNPPTANSTKLFRNKTRTIKRNIKKGKKQLSYAYAEPEMKLCHVCRRNYSST